MKKNELMNLPDTKSIEETGRILDRTGVEIKAPGLLQRLSMSREQKTALNSLDDKRREAQLELAITIMDCASESKKQDIRRSSDRELILIRAKNGLLFRELNEKAASIFSQVSTTYLERAARWDAEIDASNCLDTDKATLHQTVEQLFKARVDRLLVHHGLGNS